MNPQEVEVGDVESQVEAVERSGQVVDQPAEGPVIATKFGQLLRVVRAGTFPERKSQIINQLPAEYSRLKV